MSLRSLLTHSVTVSRLADAGAGKKVLGTVESAVPCLIQPVTPESAQAAGMSWESAFAAWFLPDANILEADKLTDQDGRDFRVRGIRLRNYGTQQHKQALLQRDAQD